MAFREEEKEREGEREKHQCEQEASIGLYLPYLGLNLQPGYVP